MQGGSGKDTVWGDAGEDMIYGGPGADTIYPVGDDGDIVDCGLGTDTVKKGPTRTWTFSSTARSS